MARVLAAACVILGICFGGSAWAKPKIAILGLEAAPGSSGAVDPTTTQVARSITRELRQRAQAVASPYAVASNSSKELTDEKLLMSCDSEAPSCMAVIGAGLAADVLLYGRVEKKGELYKISLKRLDVKTKTIVSEGEDLPVGSAVAGLAKRMFVKLVGASSVTGTLMVKAMSQTGALVGVGNVTIDEESRGKLSAGRVTLSGLAEGRHVLAIEASGYRRFEETVTIHGGEQATINALLLVRDAVTDEPDPGTASTWKVALGASLAVAAVGGAFAGFGAYEVYGQGVTYVPGRDGMKPIQVTDDDCGQSFDQIEMNKHATVTNKDVFTNACNWKPRIYYGLAIAGVGVVGAAISYVMLSRSPEVLERPRTGGRHQQPSVAVAPIVTPSLTGASLSVRW
jgi:PEGA domain